MDIGDFTCYGCGLPDHPGVPCPVGRPDSPDATQDFEEVAPDSLRDIPPAGPGVPGGASDHAPDAPSSSTLSAGKDQSTRVPEPSPVKAHEPSLAPIYVPTWTIREDQTTQTGRVCRELLNHFCPPRERERLGLFADEQLEVRANVVLAQNVALGTEMQSRWEQRIVEMRHLQDQFKEEVEVSQQQMSDLEHLSSHLHLATEELAAVKREVDASAARIADLEQENSELYRENQSFEIKLGLPNLPAGHVSLPEAELADLRASSHQATSEVQVLQELVTSKDREKVFLTGKIASFEDANREVIRKRDVALEVKSWLLREGIKVFTSKLMDIGDFLGPLRGVCEAAQLAGYAEGEHAGFRGARLKQSLSQIYQYDATTGQKYDDALAAFPHTQFYFFDTFAASSGLPMKSLRGLSPAGTYDDAT